LNAPPGRNDLSAPKEIELRREQLSSQSATKLVSALNTELRGRYPDPRDCHFDLSEDDVAPGRGVFIVASERGVDIGCGAVRLLDDGRAELKRLFVAPAFRGQRIAPKLLDFLESEARFLGASRIVLATGIRSPEALALYRRAGYVPIDNFDPYEESVAIVCMGKDLGPL